MEKADAIISLDLGTNSIHGVIAQINDENKIEILSADTFLSDGVRNGVISYLILKIPIYYVPSEVL